LSLHLGDQSVPSLKGDEFFHSEFSPSRTDVIHNNFPICLGVSRFLRQIIFHLILLTEIEMTIGRWNYNAAPVLLS